MDTSTTVSTTNTIFLSVLTNNSTEILEKSTEFNTDTTAIDYTTSTRNSLDSWSSSEEANLKENCLSGYWHNGSDCQKCGMCKNGFCNPLNGTCDYNLCLHAKLEVPYCNKCSNFNANFPKCDNIETNEKKEEELSSVLIILWLVTLWLLLLINFILNYSCSQKPRAFKYDLEFNTIFPTKTTFKRSDFD